jgi:tetraacyldisaccharide 4'-kinase
MFGPTEFRELISGRRRGGTAAAMRAVLRAAEAPYTLAVDWRNRRYDRGHVAVHRVSAPVISVGNLTLGGTGKTPMVKWIARWLEERGVRVAIVSRGYGAKGMQLNDEALELRHALPNVPHVQNPDRVCAAERAIAKFGCQAVLLDDGFQHRRLARNLDIVLLDSLEPFGYEHVFPRGTLREPLAGLQRADVVCLSRADTISASEREMIRLRVAEFAPQVAWCEVSHSPSGLLNAASGMQPVSAVSGRRVSAFCGIGNPAGFRHTLSAMDCEIVAWREFPDHHTFTTDDVAELSNMAASSKADVVVCTHKDLVKVQQERLGSRSLWAITIELRFLCGQASLETLLTTIAHHLASQPPALPGGS